LTAAEGDAVVAWAREFWVDGQRHAMALYLSGVLANAGINRTQGVRIVERCAEHDSDPGAKVHAAQCTYDSFADGVAVAGWQGLHDELGLSREQTAGLDQILAVFKQRTTARERPPTEDYLEGIISAADLDTLTFDPVKWVVPNLIPEGATLLVGGQKLGKSLLTMQIGLAVAYGGKLFSEIDIEQGEVLLLALEDSPRRLQDRLRKMNYGEPSPRGLYLQTRWPRFDEGGLDLIAEWAAKHEQARLIVIDILVRMRTPRAKGADLYALDYQMMADVKRYADDMRVPILVVHHNNRSKPDDPFDTINGSNGLAGAADTPIIMQRKGPGEVNLYVRGRDVEETDYALRRDPVTLLWGMIREDQPVPKLDQGRIDILNLLKRGAMAPKTIAEALGREPSAVRVTLHRMYQDGQVGGTRGMYHLPDGDANPAPDRSDDGQVIFPWGQGA
jgi:hypothetical protein